MLTAGIDGLLKGLALVDATALVGVDVETDNPEPDEVFHDSIRSMEERNGSA